MHTPQLHATRSQQLTLPHLYLQDQARPVGHARTPAACCKISATHSASLACAGPSKTCQACTQHSCTLQDLSNSPCLTCMCRIKQGLSDLHAHTPAARCKISATHSASLACAGPSKTSQACTHHSCTLQDLSNSPCLTCMCRTKQGLSGMHTLLLHAARSQQLTLPHLHVQDQAKLARLAHSTAARYKMSAAHSASLACAGPSKACRACTHSCCTLQDLSNSLRFTCMCRIKQGLSGMHTLLLHAARSQQLTLPHLHVQDQAIIARLAHSTAARCKISATHSISLACAGPSKACQASTHHSCALQDLINSPCLTCMCRTKQGLSGMHTLLLHATRSQQLTLPHLHVQDQARPVGHAHTPAARCKISATHSASLACAGLSKACRARTRLCRWWETRGRCWVCLGWTCYK